MVRMSTPARISIEACECRKLWNCLAGHHPRPRLGDVARAEQLALDRAEHQRRRLILPSPSTRRSSSCLTLWARSMATALGRQGDVAPASSRLWRLQPKAGLGLLDGPLDAKRAAVEIDVAPLEAEQLAAPHAGGEGKLDNRRQGVAGELGAHLRDLLGGEDLDLPLLDLGRPADRRHVARERAVLDGVLQHERQETVGVTDSARRQARPEQRAVPLLDVLRAKLLKLQRA